MDIKIKEARANFEKPGNQYKVTDNIRIEKEIIEGIPCYWFNNTNA